MSRGPCRKLAAPLALLGIGAGALLLFFSLRSGARSDAHAPLPGLAAESHQSAGAPRPDPAQPLAEHAPNEGGDRRRPEGLQGEAAPAAPSDPSWSGRFEGRLLDALSRTPLAGASVRVFSAGTGASPSLRPQDFLARLPCDSEGRFRSSSALPAGRYALIPDLSGCEDTEPAAPPRGPEDRRSMRRGTPLPSGTFVVELRPDARAPFVEIGTRIAASYLLDLTLPAGYGPCDLHVLALGAGAACGDATDAWRPGPPPGSRGAASKEEAPRSRLSGTGPYQVRFASTPRPCPPPWHLLVRSDDGLWAGAAPVESIEGACASLPAPRIEPRAIVRGRLRAGGELDLRGARVAYEPRAPRPGEPQFSAAIERDGEFRLAWLPPGPGRLSIRADSVRAEPIELDLRPLQELALEVPARALALAEVRGRLRVLQGELDRIPELHLEAVDPAGLPARRGRVFLEGPQRARFEFDPVPPGEYELRVLPSDSQLWQPERQRIVAPATELEILRLESELASVVLDVLAAEDLARLAEPRAYLIDGGELRAERGARGLLLLERVSPLAGPTLFVLARDRRPVEVGLGSLARNGRFLHGRIELRRGFGALVRVLDASSGEPLEGASVLGDGRELGLSDARGLFLLACEERPARVEARLQGAAASLGLEGTAPVDLLELVELRIAR